MTATKRNSLYGHGISICLASFFICLASNAQRGIDSLFEKPDVRKFASIQKALSGINTDLPSFNSTQLKLRWPAFSLPALNSKRPLSINNGLVSYYFDYRSNIDTPFADKNISQHSTVGQLGITAFGVVPLNASFFIRRTNSSLFADINDVRIDFDAARYAQAIKESYLAKLKQGMPNIRDSLMYRLKQFNLSALGRLIDLFNRPDFQQKLVECNEIINIPAIAESIAGAGKADSVRQMAKDFLSFYQTLKYKETRYRHIADSLHELITEAVAKAKLIGETIQGNFNATGESMKFLKKQGIEVPEMVKHLMSVRRFSIGRSQLNYSELTARNISLNGINFEYNSWYYFAFAAGGVDYRFRDFILSRSNRKPQSLYLVRIGLGRLEKNYFIVSGYKGHKQSYLSQSSESGSRSLEIYGISAEAKYTLNKNAYIITEIAESTSPQLEVYNGSASKGLFRWKDKTNKAYSVKLYTAFPKTKTKLEGMYRYSGAAFQSFDRFQVNSSREYWYVKAEQYLWKRQLRLVASLRSNEFSNPYIVQQYASNIIFKSIQVTFRRKRWPVLSAGYMPSSQLTRIDGQLTENRFHTLNVVAFHQYKIGLQKITSTATYNRFYNGSKDSGFIYFNAINFYMQHQVFFKRFTAGIGASHSSNTGFELNVLEESLQFNLGKKMNVSAGVRINSYNGQDSRVGSWWRLSWAFMRTGWIQGQFDDGFIPSNGNKLVRNQSVNLSINKTF